MRHTRSIALVAAMLTFGLGGCNFLGGDDSAEVATPTPVTVPTAPVAQAPNGTSAPANATGPAGILPPDLISSTNSAQRVQNVQRNRPDPFALIPTTPTVEIPPRPAGQPVPQLPSLPNQNSPNQNSPNRSIAVGRTGSAPSAARSTTSQPVNRPGTLAPLPNLVQSNPLAALPAPPQPTLAQAVKVTGVVQIGNTLHAIVSAPNEPSSRYVRVGQRLSNNQVLVKRIEMNRGSEPVVVLEQNGVEVITAVGSGGTGGEPTAAAATLPRA